MKSENLNYNSQIFILTSLFLHSISSSINASSNHYCCCYSFPQRSGLLLACCCCSSSNPWSQSHTVNQRNFSPLSISYFFFVFSILLCLVPWPFALCPLRFFMNCVDCICELWLLLDWCVTCVYCACVNMWTVDSLSLCLWLWLCIDYWVLTTV